jgi:hypothetical protein
LSDALNATITMSLKFQQDIINHVILDSTLDDEIGGYLDVELIKLPKNIKRQVISVLDPFLSFLRRFEPKKVHNMLCLMLDPWYKNL